MTFLSTELANTPFKFSNKRVPRFVFYQDTFHHLAGRTGPGDSSILHNLLFDDSGPIAFHSAAHDAFGYLLNYHEVGPGYKYLSGFSIFDTTEPLSDQISGVEFWSELLRKRRTSKRGGQVY